MKKFVYVFCLLLASFTFTACPLIYDMDDQKFMTPEELVEKMNENFDTHFTLKKSEEVIMNFDYDNDDYKYLVVTLEADDLPGKEVKAYQIFKWALGYELTDMPQAYIDTPRVLCNFIEKYLVTDYYFIKYKDDLFAKTKEIYNPLLLKLNEDEDYLLVIKPDILSFPIENLDYSPNTFKDANDILKRARMTYYLLIHSENYLSEEEVCSKLELGDDFYCYPFSEGYVYYSSKFSPAGLTSEDFVKDDFYSKTDIENNLIVKYQVF